MGTIFAILIVGQVGLTPTTQELDTRLTALERRFETEEATVADKIDRLAEAIAMLLNRSTDRIAQAAPPTDPVPPAPQLAATQLVTTPSVINVAAPVANAPELQACTSCGDTALMTSFNGADVVGSAGDSGRPRLVRRPTGGLMARFRGRFRRL